MSKLERARKFLGGIVRKTALTVVPIAVFSLAPAMADVVTPNHEFINNSEGSSSALETIGGVQGIKLFGNSTCLEVCSSLGLSWYGSYTNSGSGFSVPFSYEFFANQMQNQQGINDVGSMNWYLYASGFTFGSGSGISMLSGTANFGDTVYGQTTANFQGYGFWAVYLDVQGTDIGSLTVPGRSIDINPSGLSPVPEPSTYALMLISGAGFTLVGMRRRRQSQQN